MFCQIASVSVRFADACLSTLGEGAIEGSMLDVAALACGIGTFPVWHKAEVAVEDVNYVAVLDGRT